MTGDSTETNGGGNSDDAVVTRGGRKNDGHGVAARIIAPSSKGPKSNLETFKTIVRDLGMTPHMSDSIYGDGDPFYANTDQLRADDLVDALTGGDGTAAVVWCALGGSGASRLIPYLERLPEDRKRRIRDNRGRKVLVGYSDVTALHAYLNVMYDWQTIHGTMLELIADRLVDQQSVDALAALLVGDGRQSARVRYDLRPVVADGHRPPAPSFRSRVLGGNLTLVENAVGTVCQLRAVGAIVFLEDNNCRPYALERSLDHLRQATVLDGAAAVVFGSFVGAEVSSVELVFRRFAAAVPFPVFRLDGVGHSFVNNPLPLNTGAVVSHRGPDAVYTLTVDNVYADDSVEVDADQARTLSS